MSSTGCNESPITHEEQIAEALITEVQKAILITAQDSIATIVLRIMEQVEKCAHSYKGVMKKEITRRVISQIDTTPEMKSIIEQILLNGVLDSMIDGFVDVARKKVNLQKEIVEQAVAQVPKQCCNIQ